MVRANEIRDENTLVAWLEARPKDTRQRDVTVIAHRAAMRVLPIFVLDLGKHSVANQDLAALPFLRTSLTSEVCMANMSIDVENALSSAIFSLSSSTKAVSALPALSAAISAISTTAAAFFVSVTRSAAVLNSTRDDAAVIEAGNAPQFSPLWMHLETPGRYDQVDPPYQKGRVLDEFSSHWHKARTWLSDLSGYEFWIRWYESALYGRPLTDDWNSHFQLLTDIALIPNEDWQKGAVHVARLIAAREERHRLLAQTRRLQAELAPIASHVSSSRVGHNNPPEELTDIEAVQAVSIIWLTLNDAERELEKVKPSRQALRKIARTLLNAAIAMARYCAKLTDKALQKAAEEVGSASAKWTITLGGGTLIVKMMGLDDAIRTLAEAIARYAGG